MDVDDERLAQQLQRRRAERTRRERLEREERDRARRVQARRARRRLLIAAIVLFVPAAVWAGSSATVAFLGWAGTGAAASMLWIGLAVILTSHGADRRLAWIAVAFIWLWAVAILVGDLRSPRTVTLSVAHVGSGRYATVKDRAGRAYDVRRAIRHQVRVGGTYRCTGQDRPVLGLYLQHCRPVRRQTR